MQVVSKRVGVVGYDEIVAYDSGVVFGRKVLGYSGHLLACCKRGFETYGSVIVFERDVALDKLQEIAIYYL